MPAAGWAGWIALPTGLVLAYGALAHRGKLSTSDGSHGPRPHLAQKSAAALPSPALPNRGRADMTVTVSSRSNSRRASSWGRAPRASMRGQRQSDGHSHLEFVCLTAGGNRIRTTGTAGGVRRRRGAGSHSRRFCVARESNRGEMSPPRNPGRVTRYRRFESCFLQQPVCLSGEPRGCKRKAPHFGGGLRVAGDVRRDVAGDEPGRLRPFSLTGIDAVPPPESFDHLQ
jgi:hypothetical protein